VVKRMRKNMHVHILITAALFCSIVCATHSATARRIPCSI
jgi:hypothetical protein